jgi:hypothetical protein
MLLKEISFTTFLKVSLFAIFFLLFSNKANAICAQVKIEIHQELTLERQAFNAYMRINNGLSSITLEDIHIDVLFSDENGRSVIASSDPNDTHALFFVRLDSTENIENIAGNGTVAPSTSADIRWLIIPAPGASNGLESGKLYYVGAILTYTINGLEHITEVSPDYIFVKPMPELVLDYFLPTDVYGDDAFTSEIEPSVPFPLGVRVSNNGSGIARNLRINSAQPKIVENELGLLIGFHIESSEVNGRPAVPSLLVDFGDIPPNRAGTAQWNMTCSLSGQFVEFSADFSHADELGGEMTSLIDAVNTRILVKDVLVDLPGRDQVRDFLARFGQGYRLYESDNIDTPVTDQSENSEIVRSGVVHILSTPVTAGFMYVKLPDPFDGGKALSEVLRSDGKRIKPENAWLSKSRDGDNQWRYFVNLFDADGTGSYFLAFDDIPPSPIPILQFIPDRFRGEGMQIGFIVQASVPDGSVPEMRATPLPAGASFIDNGTGVGLFDWTPAPGQAGEYIVKFTAANGEHTADRTATITIAAGDSDNDGMPDWWELQHFGTLERDGTGDYDGDGKSDLQEYLDGTDPAFFPGDINNDHRVDLRDALVALQVLSGIFPESQVKKEVAVEGLDRITRADAIFALQSVAGGR